MNGDRCLVACWGKRNAASDQLLAEGYATDTRPSACYTTGMTVPRRATTLALIATALTFVLPAAAHAGLAFTKPAANAYVTGGQKLAVSFSMSCPADKQCGSLYSDGGAFTSRIFMNFEHATRRENSFGVVGYASQWVGLSDVRGEFHIEEDISAGAWTMFVRWAECPAGVATHQIQAADCSTTIVKRPLRVRAMIGYQKTASSVNLSAEKAGSRVAPAYLLFGCNALAKHYRADLVLQKAVKRKGRTVWVTAVTGGSNLRAKNDPMGGLATPRCFVKRSIRIPATLKASDRVRARYIVRTVGLAKTLSSKPRTVYSAPQTVAEVMAGFGGGGVTVGS